MSWTREDEKRSKQLTINLMDLLVEKDGENIKAASKHLRETIKHRLTTQFKDALKDTALSLVTPPGLALGKAMGEQTTKMLTKAYARALMATQKMQEGKDQDESKPYNYLATLFSHVLAGEAKDEERSLFIKWYVNLGFMVASTATAGITIAPVADGTSNAVAKVVDVVSSKGVDLVVDKIEQFVETVSAETLKHLASKDKEAIKDATKYGPLAWAIYLAGQPRGAPSEKENWRLALRISLGYAIDDVNGGKDPVRFRWKPLNSHKPPTPKDVADLFESVLNPKIKPADNYKKLQAFNDRPFGHISYLSCFLSAEDKKGALNERPFKLHG